MQFKHNVIHFIQPDDKSDHIHHFSWPEAVWWLKKSAFGLKQFSWSNNSYTANQQLADISLQQILG